ncbi:hypothetical protein [Victivallis sp.]|uniref:hypothetical protein n=1 Tax=Victivallis sp. TaxID=2049020 RepID=UPI003A8FACEB
MIVPAALFRRFGKFLLFCRIPAAIPMDNAGVKGFALENPAFIEPDCRCRRVKQAEEEKCQEKSLNDMGLKEFHSKSGFL